MVTKASDLMTVADAARIAGVTNQTVMRAIRAGGLKANKISGSWQWFIEPQELRAWLESSGRRVPSSLRKGK